MNNLVIGIGNDFRRDDGVGLAVVQAIGRLDLPGVETMTAIGVPGVILDAWAGRPAVVVDAAAGSGMVPGRIRRWTPEGATTSVGTSSHSFGLAQTYALGRALGLLPASLVVFTVDIADAGMGPGLSAQVSAAIPDAVEAVLAEIAVTYDPS
ncbi:hydrogenase maturation protease [Mycolicibacterium sp. 120270]|uniref:hydrogenase maturation protease n=1 Tax=Mycolicibacterium sp. 120270 TaxID=3090600 RepID=UPI00299ED9B6|nr:hydrogenase maturation protease [Mycolicibacterium sp. 120270]MDX1886010.1 hydrogenase maturation protease [Mycolicibacterium sp. 120270]